MDFSGFSNGIKRPNINWVSKTQFVIFFYYNLSDSNKNLYESRKQP